MKLTFVCFFIQVIFLYRRVGCGIDQAVNLFGQASNLMNGGGLSSAGGLLNAAGGLSNAGNLMSGGGGGLLNMMQNSYFTPAPIKGAIVAGKAVAKGVQTYSETGNFTKAGMAATSAGLENAVNVVNNVPGAKLGLGVIKDFKNGESWSTIITNGGKEAIGFVPMGEQVRELAMTGVSAAQAYKEGKSAKEVVTEGVKGTLKNYASKHPLANEVNKYVEIGEKVAAFIPKDEPGAKPTSWFDKATNVLAGGIEMAQNSPLAPAPLKGAIVAGKALAKGVEAYKESGDLRKAGLVATSAGLQDAVGVTNNVPGAKIGMNLLNDLKNGESIQTMIMNGGKEAINFLPADGPAKDLAMKGIGAAEALKEGRSVTNVVSEGVKGTLMDYASKHPLANEVKKYAEIGERVAAFLPKNEPGAPPSSLFNQAPNLVSGAIEMVKDNPLTPAPLKGAIVAGKALAKGVEAYKKSGDLKQAGKVATSAGLESASKVVNNVPGAKLGVDLLNNLNNGESLQTAILNGGREAIDFLPADGLVKDLAMQGIGAAEALKEGKSVKGVVTEGVKGTILNYAAKHPLTKEVEKYVDMGEKVAALSPKTEQQNINPNMLNNPINSANSRINHARLHTVDAQKSYIRQSKRRGLKLLWSKTDETYK